MDNILQIFSDYYLIFSRYLFAVFFLLAYLQLRGYMLTRKRSGHVFAVLDFAGGVIRLPITEFESVIGGAKSCDIKLPGGRKIARQLAVLSVTSDGRWKLKGLNPLDEFFINDEPMDDSMEIHIGDVISVADLEMTLLPATDIDAKKAAKERRTIQKEPFERIKKFFIRKPAKSGKVSLSILMLNYFQIAALITLLMSVNENYRFHLIISFVFLIALPWVYRVIALFFGIKNTAAEMTAFFCTTIGICAIASANPANLIKQIGALILGILLFLFLCVYQKDVGRLMKYRKYFAIASVCLLLINLIFGTTVRGQRNWIDLGFTTIQPSEFVKILFVLTGAATLEWLLTSKNLLPLTAYASLCVGMLFLMKDFGTAVIFFVTFIVLIFMTSGDIRAIGIICAVAVIGAVLLLNLEPRLMSRFSNWGHIWEDPYGSGYQQTRTLMAIASGGFFGLGGGNGFLKNVSDSGTDMVFGVICEEWGLIIGVLIIGCYILIMRSAISSGTFARSSYYVIAACTAGVLLLFQASLNIFGSTDIIPFTGVTLPFISNGGSSMVASWGLLSFITSALNYTRPQKGLEAKPVPISKKVRR